MSDLAVRSGLFLFLAALLFLLVVGELARLACTSVGSCLTVEVRCSSASFSEISMMCVLKQVSQALEEASRILWSQTRRFRCGFSVVGAREAVCCWSCQPSLSVSVASRVGAVSFQGHDLGLSPVHFSDVVLAFSVSWCRFMGVAISGGSSFQIKLVSV